MTQLESGNSERYPALDGIRGLAVLMVWVWHYIPCLVSRDAGWWAPYIRRLLYVTGSGVDLFFALSGFLIVGILIDKSGQPNFLRHFYLRRSARIFPLYFVMLGLFVLLKDWQGLPEDARRWLFENPMPLGSYATFTQNIFMGLQQQFGPGWLAVTWSLAVEEQFYLIIPLLLLLLGKRKLPWLFVAGICLLPCLRMISPGFHAYVNLPWRADPLLAGACAAFIVRSASLRGRCLAGKAGLIACGCLLLGGVATMIVFPGCLGMFDQTLYAGLYTLLILIARLELHPPLCRVLKNPALKWIGLYSYGIYLSHQGISGLMHGLIKGQAPQIVNFSDAILTLSAAVVTFVVAGISYRFLEEPILRLSHRHSQPHPSHL
jgi:peptidoglycan/LPS O-acetylase OafA/YrhL